MDPRAWDERYRSVDLVWGAEPNRFIREECQDLAPGDAIDLACGEGRNALWLARQGWRVHALDFSSVAIERAAELTAREDPAVAARITWTVADVTTSALAPGFADLVIMAYLHLMPAEQSIVVGKGARAVRRGGRLVIVGHDKRNLTEGVSGPQDLTLLHDPTELAREAEEHGLRVEVARTVERPTDAGVALDTLVRARRP
jgi:2-polyprenyl-3-methyl-5-hydroxy-6-metoxy-1,4-benzoquinol methylase